MVLCFLDDIGEYQNRSDQARANVRTAHKKSANNKKANKKKEPFAGLSLSPTHTKLRIFGYPSHVHPIVPPNPFISKYDAMFGENSKRLVGIGAFYFGAGGPSPPASRSSKMQQAYAG
jgi:hypothetical protein